MSRLEKRSIALSGHATSVALEPEFWRALERMVRSEPPPNPSLAELIRQIDDTRGERPLASACRVAALRFALARSLVPPGS